MYCKNRKKHRVLYILKKMDGIENGVWEGRDDKREGCLDINLFYNND